MSISSCLASALFGSAGSVIGKLALDSSYTQPISDIVERFLRAMLPTSLTLNVNSFELIVFYFVRAVLVGLMLFCNSIMLNFLVRSMKALGTAPATTVINAFSFCLSVLISVLTSAYTALQINIDLLRRAFWAASALARSLRFSGGAASVLFSLGWRSCLPLHRRIQQFPAPLEVLVAVKPEHLPEIAEIPRPKQHDLLQNSCTYAYQHYS